MGSLLADPRQLHQEGNILLIDSPYHLIRPSCRENAYGNPWSDSGHIQQPAEKRLLLPGFEPVQLHGVFPHMIMNE
ncbi:hypothetical protein D3C73_1454830 [compost metagenome]